ncbi:hypothetical protein [Halococcus sp. IIIV-5B]|uniref:hypothetical protein n=1 Tax=Halococcus sp. IIIV-5B TaxID=2321230 RepID=UPI000E72523F|nr:hypothetical protein [Halococcus sp. IIIV-5B]RJT05234.1 hypothetical protein D3261_07580 [Halococcus sp. IIIV-5B]
MNEDELTNALIRHHKRSERAARSRGERDVETKLYPEEHYNHYGDRGVVDLYQTTGRSSGHLYEVKSESAVRHATGANEIVRQFNRMRGHFYPGTDHPVPDEVHFELCFLPTALTARHLVENAEMYAQCVANDVSRLDEVDRVVANVCFRLPDPENVRPVVAFTSTSRFHGITNDSFPAYAVETNPAVYERIRSSLVRRSPPE